MHAVLFPNGFTVVDLSKLEQARVEERHMLIWYFGSSPEDDPALTILFNHTEEADAACNALLSAWREFIRAPSAASSPAAA